MSSITYPARYQIFLSSTYEDLREERQQATQAILEMGHFPAGMELFPASDQSQAQLIQRVISESDYYVLILAGRYGSADLSGLSYTEMEYDWAVQAGLPIISFVRRSVDDVQAKWVEKDQDKRDRLEQFRRKVMSRMVRLYDTPSELGMQVMKSLMNEARVNPRVGWIRADQLPTVDPKIEADLRDQLAAKSRELSKLQRKLRDTIQKIPELDNADLARGSDLHTIDILFQNNQKKHEVRTISISWDEIFSTIAPSMYGYVQRRFRSGYNHAGNYSFESDLLDLLRMKTIDDVGSRKISIFSHQVDTILIQFQQLGLIAYSELEKEGEEAFRGYTLTPDGETYLAKIKLAIRRTEK